jgi:hypothetical protein
LLNEPTPSEIVLDKDYMAELQRRAAMVGEGPIADQTNPKTFPVVIPTLFFTTLVDSAN